MASVRSASQNSATSGTAITVSAPAGVTAGDVVIVVTNLNGTSTSTTDNNGSTPFTKDSAIDNWSPPTFSQTNSISIWTRTIQVGDPSTYAFTGGSSQRWGIVAVAIQSPNTTSFYDVAPAVANRNETANNGDSIDAPSITTLTNNTIHIALGLQDASSTSITSTPTGYTKAEDALNQPVAFYYKAIAVAGATGTASAFNWSSFGTKCALSFAIKNASTTSTSNFFPFFGP